MRFRLRPLTLALALAGISAQASATDLVQAYELARNSDPQFASSEALKDAQPKAWCMSRAALLPQVTADASFSRSESRNTGNQVFAGQPTPTNTTSGTSNSRGTGINLRRASSTSRTTAGWGASKARARQAESEYGAPPPTR
jgi:outer membrane protein